MPSQDAVITERNTIYASVQTSIRVCCSILLSTGELELILRTVNRITALHVCLKGPQVVLVGVATYATRVGPSDKRPWACPSSVSGLYVWVPGRRKVFLPLIMLA
jgi:hypothetical protein